MDELGMTVPEDVRRYGSDTFSADTESLAGQRFLLVQEEFKPALELLLEKKAHVTPEAFASSLEEFDRLTGLNYFWDTRVPDPYYTTFGPSHEKLAEENWSWDQNGVHLTLENLKHLSRNGGPLLIKHFGEDFFKEFSKSPKGTFESLPMPNKLMIARLATSRHDGTLTE